MPTTDTSAAEKVTKDLSTYTPGFSFWKNLKSRYGLKFTNHLGNHCLFHA